MTVKWITRQRPKVDRIACPWLIRRFIDPSAEIVYVPADEVLATAEREGGHSFDAKGATYSHRKQLDGSQWCTFETLIHDHGLSGDPALMELARIVHAADMEADDIVLLQRASFVYDALYAHCQRTSR